MGECLFEAFWGSQVTVKYSLPMHEWWGIVVSWLWCDWRFVICSSTGCVREGTSVTECRPCCMGSRLCCVVVLLCMLWKWNWQNFDQFTCVLGRAYALFACVCVGIGVLVCTCAWVYVNEPNGSIYILYIPESFDFQILFSWCSDTFSQLKVIHS